MPLLLALLYLKMMKPIEDNPMVKRIPPKKLQPSNWLPFLPEGSTGFVVVEEMGETVVVLLEVVEVVLENINKQLLSFEKLLFLRRIIKTFGDLK